MHNWLEVLYSTPLQLSVSQIKHLPNFNCECFLSSQKSVWLSVFVQSLVVSMRLFSKFVVIKQAWFWFQFNFPWHSWNIEKLIHYNLMNTNRTTHLWTNISSNQIMAFRVVFCITNVTFQGKTFQKQIKNEKLWNRNIIDNIERTMQRNFPNLQYTVE